MQDPETQSSESYSMSSQLWFLKCKLEISVIAISYGYNKE